jgi:hypothetical protein
MLRRHEPVSVAVRGGVGMNMGSKLKVRSSGNDKQASGHRSTDPCNLRRLDLFPQARGLDMDCGSMSCTISR